MEEQVNNKHSSGNRPSRKNPKNARINQILSLEKKLSVLLKTKNPSCQATESLRLTIRDRYESLILEDASAAEALEAEQALWRLHYRKIDEFRTQLRTIFAPQRGGGSVDQHTLLQALAPFKGFLAQASNFYLKLIAKLRQSCGLLWDAWAESSSDNVFSIQVPNVSSGRDGNSRDLMQSQVSCCRCLLYLGDLARYEQLYSVLGGQARDWSTAAKYYRQAAAMWPSGGNPHNQLAVLATYVRDELLAVYYYIRSLSVENPFVTAKENLRLLFEKNQQRFEQSPGLTDLLGKAERFSGNNSGCVQWADINLPEIIQGQQTNSELVQLLGGIDELQKQFQHCYVRLIGIVFTQTRSKILRHCKD